MCVKSEPVSPSSEESYYGAVESHFVLRRGSPLFITPSEWALVSRWEEQGIPLHVVMDGIDRVFERPRTSARTRKLSYCRQTVEAAFRRFREGMLGGDKAAREEEPFDLAAYLGKIAASVRKLPSGLAPAIADEVEALSLKESGFEDVERHLSEMDRRMLDIFEGELGEAERTELERGAAASLASYRDRMPDKVYHAAVKSAYRRRLRARWHLPRLTLFDR